MELYAWVNRLVGMDERQRIETPRLQDTKRPDTGFKGWDPVSVEMDEICRVIVDSAFKVHKALGPGLLESVYERCLCHELSRRGIPYQTQLSLPIIYDGVRIESALRIDLVVDGKIIVELKAAEAHPIHKAQLLTYLELSGSRLGLLINFNVPLIRDGITRLVL